MFGNLNMMREASICLARAIKQRPLVGFYGYINMKLSSFLMLLCAISYLSYRYLMHGEWVHHISVAAVFSDAAVVMGCAERGLIAVSHAIAQCVCVSLSLLSALRTHSLADYSDIQTHGELSGGDGERRLSADGSSACLLRVTEAVTPWLAFVLLHACLLSVVRTVLRMNPCWMFP